jgi:hypothetical protein
VVAVTSPVLSSSVSLCQAPRDLGPAFTALLLHVEHARNRVEQFAVCLLQGFDVYDLALRLFLDVDRLRFHHLGRLTHHLVCRVGDRLLQLERRALGAFAKRHEARAVGNLDFGLDTEHRRGVRCDRWKVLGFHS